MTREEWYKHRTLDHLEQVSDYLDIMLDDAIETDLTEDQIQTISNSIYKLMYDIHKQIDKLGDG